MSGKRGARWGPLRGEYSQMRRLATMLRDLADQHRRPLRELERLMPYSKSTISERLSGASRPDWEFIQQLVRACVGTDAQAEDVLLSRIRPVWENADPARADRIGELVLMRDVLPEAMAAADELEAVQRHAADLQLVLHTNTEYIAGLAKVLALLNDTVQQLTAERDKFQREIAKNSDLNAKLIDTQHRLETAEEAREHAERLLEEAQRQRAEAMRLRDDALRDLELAMSRMGTHAVGVIQQTGSPAKEVAIQVTTGAELSAVTTVLQRADQALIEEAATLQQLGAESMSGERPPDIVVTLPPKIPEVWGRVPPPNEWFTGRGDHLRALQAAQGRGRPSVLVGFAGVGKTQIAVEYAHRYQEDYDLVWWINADQELLIPAGLAALAPFLGLPPVKDAGIEDTASAVLHALRKGEPHSRWLLIFDGANDPEDVNDLILRGPGDVIVTTRYSRWEAIVRTIRVDVLPREESTEFLRRRLPYDIGSDDASRLAHELGDLPLALETAATLQAETGMTPDGYLRMLEAQPARLLSERKPMGYRLSVAAAYKLSHAMVEQSFSVACVLLRCCAFFNPEPIPLGVFTPHQALGADLFALLSDPLMLGKAVSILAAHGLVQLNAADRTIRVHRLFQALLRDEVADEEKQRQISEVHVLLACYLQSLPETHTYEERYEFVHRNMSAGDVATSGIPEVCATALPMARYLQAAHGNTAAAAYAARVLEGWSGETSPTRAQDVLDLQDLLHRMTPADEGPA